MPVHDWTRVTSGNFHDFHQRWIVSLSDALNSGILPDGYYTLAEQHAAGPIPDVLALETTDPEFFTSDETNNGGSMLAVDTHPPQVAFTDEEVRDLYAERADRVAIYHANGDRVLAYVEIVSPGNKHTEAAFQSFCEKLDEALERGCHLLVIDLHPPGKHDPHGLHQAFWESRHGDPHTVTQEKPLGLSAYRVRLIDDRVRPKAYFEPVAVGQKLPDMPLFVTPKHYVNAPLEQSYMEAWRGVPDRWKQVIEGESSVQA